MSEVAKYNEVDAELSVVEGNSVLTPADLLRSGQGFISTMASSTPAEKLQTLSILSNPQSLSENQGVVIELAGIMAQKSKFRNNEGDLQDGLAVYLVDKSNQAYISVSSGIATAIMQFVGIFGSDPAGWPAGLTLTPRKINIGKGKTTWTVDYGTVSESSPAKK